MNQEKLLLIDPTVLIKYLLKKNWVPGFQKNGIYSQYISPDGNDAVIIPINKNSSDYVSVLDNTIKLCSQLDAISIDNLYTILTSPPSDIVRWRINNVYTKNGIIPLDNIDEVLDAIKNSIATTAKDILSPGKYHKTVLTSDVKQLLSSYAIGQTERGSYIFNLLCPLGEKQLEFFDNPLSRRVNERLISSIINIQNDISNNNVSKIEEEVEQNIYSVNFLDTIVDLNESSKSSGLEISVNWNLGLPIKSGTPNSVVIVPSMIESISHIAEKLRPIEETAEQTFYGKISSIKTAPEIESRNLVTITIVTLDEERKINITANLDYSYFDNINTAFENGYQVKAKGKLISTPKKKVLQDCSLEVLID